MPVDQRERLARLRKTVAFLCSPECGGRATGSPEGGRARDFIEARFQEAGLEPAGEEGFRQRVPSCGGVNLLGKLPGQGERRERAVLVAAHYDHLGWAKRGVAFWGADDNAAAVAILLDVAEMLGQSRHLLGRQVVFCAFDAEEPPFFLTEQMGSRYFTRHPTVPLENIDMMVCMDLMGHAVGGPSLPESVRNTLFVLGAERSERTAELVGRAALGIEGLHPRRLASDVIPALSDYHAFELEEVPFLFLTNGRWVHYHQVTDTPDKLDYDKMRVSADFLSKLMLELSNRGEPRIAYRATHRDDASTLGSLWDLANVLAHHHVQAKQLLPVIEAMLVQAKRGATMNGGEQRRIAQLVFALEAMLLGTP